LMTCDTVPIETFARSAICRIVTGAVMANRRSLRVYYATKPDSPEPFLQRISAGGCGVV
jgi:hypothetical protein